eukprot:679253-Amphidinium_carterae.2
MEFFVVQKVAGFCASGLVWACGLRQSCWVVLRGHLDMKRLAGEEKVWSDDTTTVMLRNIPVRYTAEEALRP